MKRAMIIILLFLSYFMASVQTFGIDYEYFYDAAGNRTKIIRQSLQFKQSQQEEDVLANHKIKLYPNPTVDLLKISLEGISAENHVVIELFSINGKKLYSSTLSKSEQGIDFRDKAAGVYLLNILIDDKSSFWRIIKE